MDSQWQNIALSSRKESGVSGQQAPTRGVGVANPDKAHRRCMAFSRTAVSQLSFLLGPEERSSEDRKANLCVLTTNLGSHAGSVCVWVFASVFSQPAGFGSDGFRVRPLPGSRCNTRFVHTTGAGVPAKSARSKAITS
jgi:hypothetical protein